MKSAVTVPLKHYKGVAVDPLSALLDDREAKLKAAFDATDAHNTLARSAGAAPASLRNPRAKMLAA